MYLCKPIYSGDIALRNDCGFAPEYTYLDPYHTNPPLPVACFLLTLNQSSKDNGGDITYML